MFIQTTRVDNGRGVLINADHVDTIEAITRDVRVVIESGATVETQADFSKLHNMLAVVIVRDGSFPD